MRNRKQKLILSSRVIGIILIIIILGYFFTQSSMFLNLVRKTVISQVNKQINGSVEIAGIEGNIFKRLTIKDFVLSDERAELVNLKQLDLNYDLGHLIHKKVIVKSIFVSDLTVNLHQDAEGVWNLTKIYTAEEDTTTTEKTPSSWQIDLESFILSNSIVKISGSNLPELYPKAITISQLIFHASLGEEIAWELSKADVSIQPQEISLSLRDLKGNGKPDISLEQLKISSPKSQILLSGNLINEPIRNAKVNFEVNPLDFEELQTWIPSFPIQGNHNLSGSAVIRGDSLSTEIVMNSDEQVIRLEAQLPNLQKPLTSQLDLVWEKLNSNNWKSNLPQSNLNGSLVASIHGESWPNVETELTLNLKDSDYNTYKIESLMLKSNGSPSQLSNTLLLDSEFGKINVKADLRNLLTDIGYAVSGSLTDLELMKILPTLPYQADINSQFNINGKGTDPKDLDVAFNINLSESSLDNIPIEKLRVIGEYQQGNYSLSEMELSYDGINVSANGHGDIYENNELTYNLQLDALPQIVQKFIPDLDLKGNVSGTASGIADDLKADTSIDLHDIKFQTYELASFTGESEIRLLDKKPEAEFTGSLTNISLPTLPIDSLRINTHYTPEKVFLDIMLTQSDTLDLQLTGDIFPTLKQANFSKLELNAFGKNWQNKPDTLKLSFDPKKLSLRNLELNSETQTIIADFTLDSQVNYNLRIKCDSLSLSPLRFLNPALETIQGKLSLNIAGNGELENPQLSATWNLDSLSLRGVSLHKIAGSIDYQSSLAHLGVEINRTEQESISLNGYLPFVADLTNKKFNLLKDEPLNLELKMTPLDLSNLNDYTDSVKEIKGELNLWAKVENTLNHPLLNSTLSIENAAFKQPTFGIDYRDLNLDFKAQNNMIELKNLSLPSGKKGFLKATGSTVLDLKSGQLDSLQFSIQANDFQALKNRDMDLKFESNITIAGNSNEPTFSGYLKILRAQLYLPTLMGMERKREPLTTPLLLVGVSADSLSKPVESKTDEEPSQMVKNMRGNLKLSFPRNIWLKSEEMNMELGGELVIIKSSPDFVLSGKVMVVRGNYTAYGRRFNIVSGNVYFRGERDIDPAISIVANYILRSSSQEKLTLSIQVTGSLKQPVIQFYLDDEPISEGDGISYIIFGKSTAELSSGERDQVNGSGQDNLATKIVVGQITSKITSQIQKQLNLDVVEFKGDTNWRQAQVVVGKYITNNLFLSYERELSFGSGNEVVPERVTLEYELRRRLYLQATQGGDKATGVDLIWKFQK